MSDPKQMEADLHVHRWVNIGFQFRAIYCLDCGEKKYDEYDLIRELRATS